MRPLGRGWVAGRTVLDQEMIHVPDLPPRGDEFPLGSDLRNSSATVPPWAFRSSATRGPIGCLLLRRTVGANHSPASRSRCFRPSPTKR